MLWRETTKQDRELAVRLRLGGVSYGEIGKQSGMSKFTLSWAVVHRSTKKQIR